ncbi:MAG TPA: polysaccharide biosynthesis C-terminal domain-containing protein [Blastocatellia bacterium]|nr:polysaccharide biosynthesis C-terminal domain-containing protein [Blastocatellia bacterium]HMX24504.1 polysaccharide biosynthesis C-terminal domain-containing protein [Blastocatellia bacterium]HMY75047.1 polysaccharide biosynthesis C-terminal domain-containing protein [Blastocatellia bacterium]HMZ17334.1 polysaccharide biosynthesis C-terminal domain-containing protein [Blastocatellia bacterium]HNG30457.1 polysaccharide biosynthesis C-terminal domain-containing protein [Blastocatellia bacteri
MTEQARRIAQGRSGATAVMQSLAIKLLVIAVNTATGIITARMLQPEGRGELAALILWPVFLANAMTLGVPSSLVYNLRREPERASQFFAAALVLGLALGAAATLLGAAMMPYWLAQYRVEVVVIAQWMMLHAPLCTLMLIGRAALEARGEFSLSNATLLFTPLLGLLGLIGLALAGAMTPFRAALTYVFNGVPVFCWMAWRLWRLFRPQGSENVRRASAYPTLLSYGLRSYGIDLLGALSLQIDQALVVGFLSPSAMGTYVVALSLSRMLQLFQQSLVMVLFPKAAGRPAEEVIALTGRAARICTISALAAGAAVMLCGQWVLRLLYGAEFVAAANLLRLLVLEAIFTGTTMVLAQAFMALGKPGTVTVLQGVGLALSVPLMLALIPRYGLLGAGLALAISAAVRLVLMMLCFPWLLKQRSPSLWFGREDWLFLRRQLVKIHA